MFVHSFCFITVLPYWLVLYCLIIIKQKCAPKSRFESKDSQAHWSPDLNQKIYEHLNYSRSATSQCNSKDSQTRSEVLTWIKWVVIRLECFETESFYDNGLTDSEFQKALFDLSLVKGSPTLLLESYRPEHFSSNPAATHLSVIIK